MNIRDFAQKIEHTCLRVDAQSKDIERLCEEAVAHSFYGVCVAGSYVDLARKALGSSAVKLVSVVGFPHGNVETEVKQAEAKRLIELGAQELDVVIHVGALKEGRTQYIQDELEALVHLAKSTPLKLIIETSLLQESEKILACELAVKAGFAYVKTSTGFAGGGAEVRDIQLMRRTLGPLFGIKASGGIKTPSQAMSLIEAGANKIGSSQSVQLIKEFEEIEQQKSSGSSEAR